MKQARKSFITMWAAMLALFNLLVFLIPAPAGYEKFAGAFWGAYASIMLAFIGQLLCMLKAFQAGSAQKLFYNLPLITIGRTGLIFMVILGVACLCVPGVPNWLAIVIAAVVFAATAVAVSKATAAADIVEQVDAKVKTSTAFIKGLTADAEGLLSKAQTPEAKDACRKVYEALRYSDPVSNDSLGGIENQIEDKFSALSNALASAPDTVPALAEELLQLIADRNRKCKALK